MLNTDSKKNDIAAALAILGWKKIMRATQGLPSLIGDIKIDGLVGLQIRLLHNKCRRFSPPQIEIQWLIQPQGKIKTNMTKPLKILMDYLHHCFVQ